jgi:hypothetical protein
MFYGHRVKVPDGESYKRFLAEVGGLNGVVPEPFHFTGILPSFHSRMECASEDELRELDAGAEVIFGFPVSGDAGRVLKLSKELMEYVEGNPILEGMELSEARFFSGILWFREGDDDDDEESESESEDESEDDDEESEDEDEEEESEEEDKMDEDTSDEDEEKVAPTK